MLGLTALRLGPLGLPPPQGTQDESEQRPAGAGGHPGRQLRRGRAAARMTEPAAVKVRMGRRQSL